MKRIAFIVLLCIIATALSGCLEKFPLDTVSETKEFSPADGDETVITSENTHENGGSTVKIPDQTQIPETDAVSSEISETTEKRSDETAARETEEITNSETQRTDETEPAPETEKDPPAPSEHKIDVDLGIKFDTELMKYISAKTSGNYMISPLSFRYALGMMTAGASGDTLSEILSAFKMDDPSDYEEYIKQFNGFIEGFNKQSEQDKEDKVKRIIKIAGSVWKRSDIPADFTDDYKMRLEMYGAEHYKFDLSDVIKKVNEWANKKTEGLIPELLPADYDTDNLAVVLMNALYFKNVWSEPFEPEATYEDSFAAKNGNSSTKQYMERIGQYRYYSDSETTLVIIPMRGNTAVTFVIGSYECIDEKTAKAKKTTVKVKIPKFEAETSLDNKELVEFLKDCGVNLAFDKYLADFSSMIDHDIYVNDIVQKTKIKLDESGVEAAAVAAILMPEKSVAGDTVEFSADRPFAFFIHTTESDWNGSSNVIMFSGEVTE